MTDKGQTYRLDEMPADVAERAFGPSLFDDPAFRLQQLREAFEADRHNPACKWPDNVKRWSVEDCATSDETACSRLAELAKRILIAQSFGEFDRDRALMLWKLQRQ